MPYRRASSLCLCVHLVGLNPGCARTCDTLSYSLRVNLQLPSTHTNSSLWKCFIFKTPSFWSSWSHYDNEYFAKKKYGAKKSNQTCFVALSVFTYISGLQPSGFVFLWPIQMWYTTASDVSRSEYGSVPENVIFFQDRCYKWDIFQNKTNLPAVF